mmetsp:Transcript_2591/g.7964  ORF Transcript_2591/g.7964 Transcript_2591/m.7964 type:complete len:232 (-) Transcript_2591:351-1046(-)
MRSSRFRAAAPRRAAPRTPLPASRRRRKPLAPLLPPPRLHACVQDGTPHTSSCAAPTTAPRCSVSSRCGRSSLAGGWLSSRGLPSRSATLGAASRTTPRLAVSGCESSWRCSGRWRSSSVRPSRSGPTSSTRRSARSSSRCRPQTSRLTTPKRCGCCPKSWSGEGRSRRGCARRSAPSRTARRSSPPSAPAPSPAPRSAKSTRRRCMTAPRWRSKSRGLPRCGRLRPTLRC